MSLDTNEKERIQHPSFGQIAFSRVQTTGANFYGSELKQDHYITLEIKHSEIQRDLSRDWHFGKDTVTRLRLSSNQFAELLTSFNRGDGVCCTLEYTDKDGRIPELPPNESRKEFIHRKFDDRMREFARTLKTKQMRVKELTAKKTLSKADQLELNQTVEWLTTEVASNIPFFAKCFQETIDYSVNEAKSEIENAIQHKINVLGLQELHNQNKLLTENK